MSDSGLCVRYSEPACQADRNPAPSGARESNGLAAVAWCLTPGEAGFLSQATGLVRAVGCDPVCHVASLHSPWKYFPLALVPAVSHVVSSSVMSPSESPPPLIVSCGRQSVVSALVLKKRYGTRTFTVHIQNPTVSVNRFDLVVAPEHDGVSGRNVLQSVGALHHVTPETLATARTTQRAKQLACTDRAAVAVLIGGPNRYYGFSADDVNNLIANLERLQAHSEARLIIVPSRRTPAWTQIELASRFGGRHFVWDGTGDNPYLPALAVASHIVVTGDSVSMASEAASTGRPVFVVPLRERRRARRFRRFHATFQRRVFARSFDGRLDTWSYDPLNETNRIAGIIRKKAGL